LKIIFSWILAPIQVSGISDVNSLPKARAEYGHDGGVAPLLAGKGVPALVLNV